MYDIKSIKITGINNIATAEIDMTNNVNILLGDNGLGKSTFLNILFSLFRKDITKLYTYIFDEIIISTTNNYPIIIRYSDIMISKDELKKYMLRYKYIVEDDYDMYQEAPNNFVENFNDYITFIDSFDNDDYLNYMRKCFTACYLSGLKRNNEDYESRIELQYTLEMNNSYNNSNFLLSMFKNMIRIIDKIICIYKNELDNKLSRYECYNSNTVLVNMARDINVIYNKSVMSLDDFFVNKYAYEPFYDLSNTYFGNALEIYKKGGYKKVSPNDLSYNLINDLVQNNKINFCKLFQNVEYNLYEMFYKDYNSFCLNLINDFENGNRKERNINYNIEQIYFNNIIKICDYLPKNNFFVVPANFFGIFRDINWEESMYLFYEFYQEYKNRPYFFNDSNNTINQNSFMYKELNDKLNEFFVNKNVYFDNSGIHVIVNNKEVEFKHLSEGERKIIIILVLIYGIPNIKENIVLLLDEPDTSLSIEWQSKLVDIIAENNNIKCLIATQSPFIAYSDDHFKGISYIKSEINNG